MDSASPPPKQETAPLNHHIPPEIMEEILLNLPVKSLLRFRCVSKSWKSKISESWFIRKHHSRATLLHKRLAMVSDHPRLYIQSATFFSIISTQLNDKAMKNHISPLPLDVQLKAFCDELWCVEDRNSSLYLSNPFMRTYKKLPDPMFESPSSSSSSSSQLSYLLYLHEVDAVYGMCYDAVNDDYMLLKVWRSRAPNFQGTLLYSLRSDSWRETHQYFPEEYTIPYSNGEFVNGAFHWMVRSRSLDIVYGRKLTAIVSFDLSTERYKEVPQPMYSPLLKLTDRVEIAVLREMLCVWLNYRNDGASDVFVLWAMKDYGVDKSWSKMYDIRYDSIPLIEQKIKIGRSITLEPLYVYENDEILIWVSIGQKGGEIVLYKDEHAITHKEIADVSPMTSKFYGGFVCVESLISPVTWPLIGSSMKHR